MKKIEFGFSNDYNPTGSWEGIGLGQGELLSIADYYGSVGYGRDNYIIAKVVDDRFPHLVGNFIVRDAMAEMYPDGSGMMLLDQEQSTNSRQLEQYLNNESIKEKIHSIDDIKKYCDWINSSNNFFILLEMDETITSTSIIHEAFESKNEAMKSCHIPISEMQKLLSQDSKTK